MSSYGGSWVLEVGMYDGISSVIYIYIYIYTRVMVFSQE